MILKQVFTTLNGLPLKILIVTPSIHLEWSVLSYLLGFLGYLLLDPLILVSYHYWLLEGESKRSVSTI